MIHFTKRIYTQSPISHIYEAYFLKEYHLSIILYNILRNSQKHMNFLWHRWLCPLKKITKIFPKGKHWSAAASLCPSYSHSTNRKKVFASCIILCASKVVLLISTRRLQSLLEAIKIVTKKSHLIKIKRTIFN